MEPACQCQNLRVASMKKAKWPPYLPADVTVADLGDDRLAWLAAEPEIERRSKGSGWSIAGALSGAMGRDVVRDRQAQVRSTYAPAVEAAAARLTPDESSALRRTGTLPDWFFDAVEQQRSSNG
jgi:hypothetical protein